MNPKQMVEQHLFDEAIRVGSQVAQQANTYLTVSKLAVDAIEQALVFLDTGRATQARDRLNRAMIAIKKLV